MKSNSVYLRIWVLCLAGYVWLAYNAIAGLSGAPLPQVCLFKAITHLPCPSCGATRAIIVLMKGDLYSSLQMNPLGILLLAGLVLAPPWLVADAVTRRNSLQRFYGAVEIALRQYPAVSAGLIVLVIANWVWNIAKCH